MAKFQLFGKRASTGQPRPGATPPEVDLAALAAFAAGARQPLGPLLDPDTPPWAGHDPKAPATLTLSLRVNAYHLALIRHLAEREDLSQNKLLRRILLPEIEARVFRGAAAGNEAEREP